MKTKYALVLSGGGFNCAFQVGAVQFMKQHWEEITGEKQPMKFDLISGVSGGALNGVLIAMNEFSVLKDLWIKRIAEVGASEIYTSPIIDTSSKSDRLKLKLDISFFKDQIRKNLDLKIGALDILGAVFSKSKREEIFSDALTKVSEKFKNGVGNIKSVASNDPLYQKLRNLLNRRKIKGTTFTCGFVSLNSGTYHSVAHNEFSSHMDFVNGVLASTAIPVVWKPVDKISYEQKGTKYTSLNNVDGGVINVSPLGDIIKRIDEDPDECQYKVFVLNCHSKNVQYESFSEKSIGEIAIRSIYNIAFKEIFNNDVDHFLTINNIVDQVKRINPEIEIKNPEGKPIRSFEAFVINPDDSFDLGNALVANKELIHRRIVHGYYQAMRMFDPEAYNHGSESIDDGI